MNLHEQLGALEMGVDQLIQAVVAPQAENIPETIAETAAQKAPVANHVPTESNAEDVAPEAAAVAVEAAEPASAPAPGEEPAAQLQPTLEIDRPAQNEITMTIGGQTVALRAEQIGQLIEELSNARASMTPEPPPGIPPGWRFVSTKNPVMAVQKQSNGDRLLVMRHTGHGWVPFTFSPDMVIQMYMMLTKG
ncbi:hypothetical protein R69927_07231 [Paraburkholderia domus]|uniref:Phage tail protein n=1 Tax=Paraburkholderia domus TaxID=2793075 RepID=A0A9N8N957_9BURK|nr:hypothetical protein [Paraburkholderia domus]MBK5065830.1 hypothetical protein [Burkholderia sp. R-70199]MBK5091045.1 hypothetical protein [Burkholderia sp. R-69927]MBK5125345.1 hypothetical protein [Burkholderia sp. R-69980]MBK5169807.1 hypothetical protein [Burkholderia sp. R-70211]MCI0151145.1 hypothetical protein [Paraburkholderia sediminicola]